MVINPIEPAADRAAPTTDRPLVSVRGGRVSVAGGRTLLSIDELDIHAGDRLVLTGSSGSGKSLLLSTLTGRWAAGLTFQGRRTATISRVGFVPQRGLDALHPLIPLGRQLARVSRAAPERVARVLDAVGLTDPGLRRRRPTEISGGQAQRAAVALAALTDAPLILADEPTSALDHESRDLMLRLLAEVITDDQALVVATHDWVVAETIAARHLQLDHGVITEIPVASGQPEGVR